MIEILKRAKQIDKAAQKFDNGAPKKSQSNGLMDQMSRYDSSLNESVAPVQNVGGEVYRERVTNSKLPAAIQKAMLENPIPQASSVHEIDEDVVREIRGQQINESPSYSEDDENDMYEQPVRRQEVQKKRPIREEVSKPVDINESYLRKLIASEITKALPKIVEHYFESRLVKENVQFKAGNTIFSGTVMPMPRVKGKNNI
jgi:hypothetical protein